MFPSPHRVTGGGRPPPVPTGRVEDWRAGLGRSLCSPLPRSFDYEVSQHLDHATFPVPATSNAACGFPALRSPACFALRFMGPILLGRFRLWSSNLVAVEQLQGIVQPLPTPPRPAEALSFPSSHHMAPDLLFHPVLNEAKALAGVSDRKVVDPSAQDRVDQIDHPIHRLGSVAAEHLLELPQQCRSLLELRRVVRTPDAPSLRMRRKSNPRKPKLSPRPRSTIRLFSSLTSTCRAANSSRSRFSTAGSSQSCRG